MAHLPDGSDQPRCRSAGVLLQRDFGDGTDQPFGRPFDDRAGEGAQAVVMRDQHFAVDVQRHGGPTLRHDSRDARADTGISADARKKQPDLQANTRSAVVLLKASLAQHPLQRKGRVPQRVPPVVAHGLDEKKIPALDDEFPSARRCRSSG